MSEEQWRPVRDWPGYFASSMGRIKGPHRIRKPFVRPSGYSYVSSNFDGTYRARAVHVLVALAWIGPRPTPRHEIAHGDGDKLNNRPDNLRWATRKENHADKRRHGTHQSCEKNPAAKLTLRDVAEIRAHYIRNSQTHGTVALGKQYGVHHSIISEIVRGVLWRDAA